MSSSACDNCPAPTAGGNRRDFLVQPECCLETTHLAAAARKRSQSAAPPAPALRNILPGSVSRNGGPGAGDWSACTPRSQPPGIFGSFHPWKEHSGESSAAPAAGSFAHGGKGTKTPFFRPLRLELPFGGQNLSGLHPSFRATGPWRGKCLGLPLPPGPPGLYHAVWPAIDGGPMRHRPLPTDDSFCVGADVPIRPRQLPSSYGWWQPARVPRPAKQAFPNRPASGSGAEAESISCTTRAGVAEQSPGKRPP